MASDTPREAAMTDEAGLRMMQRTEEARGCHHLAKALQTGADAIVQLQSLQQRLDEQAAELDIENELECSEGESCQDRPLLRKLAQRVSHLSQQLAEREQRIATLNEEMWDECKDRLTGWGTVRELNEKVQQLEAENATLRERLIRVDRIPTTLSGECGCDGPTRIDPNCKWHGHQRQQQETP